MWLSIVPLIPFVANLMYNPGTSATGMHCTRDKSHPFYGYYAFMFNAVTNMIHEILNTALVVFLLLGIIKCNNARKKLVQTDSSANLMKIINSSLTVFSIVIINAVVFLPNFLFGFIYFSLGPDNEDTLIIMGNLYRFFGDSIVIAHSLNFFVYYFRIPSFKNLVNSRLLPCINSRKNSRSESAKP